MKKLILIITLFALPMSVFAVPSIVQALNGGITPAAIYQGKEDLLAKCFKNMNAPGAFDKCVVSGLQAQKANERTIEFFKTTSGLITKVKDYGPIAVVQADVVGADHSSAIFLVGEDGLLINTADFTILDSLTKSNLASYKALKKKYPEMLVWPIVQAMPEFNLLKDNVGQFVFSYQIKNGCNACAIVGSAQVAFYFKPSGNFLGIELIAVKSKADTTFEKK